MYACQWRASASFLRNLFFLFVVHTFILQGLAQDIEKIEYGGTLYDGTKPTKFKPSNCSQKVPVVSRIGNDVPSPKLTHVIRDQYSNKQRQKRNAPLADEDLFEFMVRIANTPAEWERIRRVLSRIKPDDEKGYQNISTSSAPPIQNKNAKNLFALGRQKLNSTRADKISTKNRGATWPSNEWIQNLINNSTEKDYFANEDEYFEIDDEEDDDDNENAVGDRDDDYNGEKEINIDDIYTMERKKTITNKTNIIKDDSNKMIIPNEKLPNFVYRRVKPMDLSQAENSAYIAVSVVEPSNTIPEAWKEQHTPTSKTDTTTHSSVDDDDKWGNYKGYYSVVQRQRHSRRKYEKT